MAGPIRNPADATAALSRVARRPADGQEIKRGGIWRYTSRTRSWSPRLILAIPLLFYTALFVTRQNSFQHNEIAIGPSNSTTGSKQLEFVPKAPPPPGSLFDPIEVEPQCDESKRRRVIDVTFINNELASLELRLNELWNVVDVFYIAESPVPFKPDAPLKPTHLTENWENFEKFHSKMVLNVLPEHASRKVEGARVDTTDWKPNFKVQEKQRKVMWQDLKRLVAPSKDDLIIRADLDELPRPHVIEELACASPDKLRTPICLQTKDSFYYYNYKCHIKNEWTVRPVVQFYHEMDWQECGSSIVNASTHCSSCFGTLDDYHVKSRSNSEAVTKPEMQYVNASIYDRVRGCKDFWLRDQLNEKMEFRDKVEEGSYPLIVAKHPERWPYMLGMGSMYEDKIN